MKLNKLADDLYIPEDFEKYHYYFADAEGKKKYTGITTALNVIAKPALIGWAARMATEYIKKSKVWELVPNTPRKIMIGDSELDELLEQAKTAHIRKRDEGAKKGTDIHSEVETVVNYWILANNGMPIDKWTEEHSESVKTFGRWAIKENITFVSSEKVLYSRKHWLAGTADLFFMKDGKLYCGDIKTYKAIYDRTPFYQCAAYSMMYEEMTKDKIHGYCIINLPKERKFKEEQDIMWSFDIEGDTKAFLAALELYRQNANFVKPKWAKQ